MHEPQSILSDRTDETLRRRREKLKPVVPYDQRSRQYEVRALMNEKRCAVDAVQKQDVKQKAREEKCQLKGQVVSLFEISKPCAKR